MRFRASKTGLSPLWRLVCHYLFLISPFFFCCLGKAVFRDCGNSWISSVYFCMLVNAVMYNRFYFTNIKFSLQNTLLHLNDCRPLLTVQDFQITFLFPLGLLSLFDLL